MSETGARGQGPGGDISDSGLTGNNEKSPSFEAALARLEEIVHRLERGEITLDESLTAFKEGSDLVRFCLDRLSAAEKAVQQLMAGEAGGLVLKTSDIEDTPEGGRGGSETRRSSGEGARAGTETRRPSGEPRDA